MLYSTPACAVKTIVPVGTAHVGWVVLATVGVVGAVGTELIVTVEDTVEQVVSVKLLTRSV
jgi:hypothetical protein